MTSPDDPAQQGGPQYPSPGGQPPQYPPPGGQPPQYPPPGGQPPQYPPGGQPPQYPPLGGQPSYPPPGGQPPYPPPGGQPFPPGAPGGMPAYATGVPGAYGAPPKRSRKKLLFVALGVIVVLIVAIVVVAVIATKDNISDIDDASVGDCISVTGGVGDAQPKAASCDSGDFTFIVAQKLGGATDSCQDSQYSELTQKDKGKLCLIPNLTVGKCYQFPSSGGSFSDFKNIDCSSADPAAGTQVVRVTDRVDSIDVSSCTGETLTFELPKPLSYCAEVLPTQ